MDFSLIETICSINVEWKFNKADLMDLMGSENGYLNGKFYSVFNIPGFRYFVRIYPNGDTKEHRGKTRIVFFWYILGEGKLTAEVTATNESSQVSKTLYVPDKNGDRCFCDTSEFFDPKNKYFVNGEFKIKAEGILKYERRRVSKVSSPVSMRWNIKEADLKAEMEESSNAFLCSKKMNVASFCDVKYYLKIYPNKTNDENKSEAFLYLHLDVGEEDKIEMVFDIYIHSANYSIPMQAVNQNYNSTGYRLCSTSDLFDPSKKYVSNGYLTLELNGIAIKEKKQFVSIFCKNGVAPKSALKRDDKDFIVTVGDNQIEVNKHVLMDASPVLSKMLESGTKEAIENKMSIEDFPFKVVEAAIKHCYRINGSRKLIFEEMLCLYKFAKKYRIRFMMDSIEEYLIKKISPSNVVCLINFSAPDAVGVLKLYRSCIDYVIKCSKHSNLVYASECLDEKLLAKMYLKTVHSSFC